MRRKERRARAVQAERTRQADAEQAERARQAEIAELLEEQRRDDRARSPRSGRTYASVWGNRRSGELG